MFDHVGIKVKNITASAKFYAAILAPLGYVIDKSGTGFGPANAPGLWLYESDGTQCTGLHIAFRAANRAAVEHFYGAGLEVGGKDNGKPGIRADYDPAYYAAYLIDLDGNNIEAVCIGEGK
ncbi:MAG TPA: VOC family protein [Burkholderiaceae bacterium]|nr:VOC family protein [Burkholderiaceae bacterium]